jgi:hypothetical protein
LRSRIACGVSGSGSASFERRVGDEHNLHFVA